MSKRERSPSPTVARDTMRPEQEPEFVLCDTLGAAGESVLVASAAPARASQRVPFEDIVAGNDAETHADEYDELMVEGLRSFSRPALHRS